MIKKIRDTNNVPKLLQELNRITRHTIEIGLFGEDNAELLMIATVHEYGATIQVTPKMRAYMAYQGMPLKASTTEIKIPERSFMRAAWESQLTDKLNEIARKSFNDIAIGRLRTDQFLEKIGKVCVKEVQDYMHSLKQPSLASNNENPSNNPLVNTGELKGAVTYKIRQR